MTFWMPFFPLLICTSWYYSLLLCETCWSDAAGVQVEVPFWFQWCHEVILKLLQGTFNCLWDRLSLILMPLYDLHKQTRPSATRLAVVVMVDILNACHRVRFPATSDETIYVTQVHQKLPQLLRPPRRAPCPAAAACLWLQDLERTSKPRCWKPRPYCSRLSDPAAVKFKFF